MILYKNKPQIELLFVVYFRGLHFKLWLVKPLLDSAFRYQADIF